MVIASYNNRSKKGGSSQYLYDCLSFANCFRATRASRCCLFSNHSTELLLLPLVPIAKGILDSPSILVLWLWDWCLNIRIIENILQVNQWIATHTGSLFCFKLSLHLGIGFCNSNLNFLENIIVRKFLHPVKKIPDVWEADSLCSGSAVTSFVTWEKVWDDEMPFP